MGKRTYTNGYWYVEAGDEESEWRNACKARRGLVILTKDLNDPENPWDIRGEHGLKNRVSTETPALVKFYQNLRFWIYLFSNLKSDGSTPELPSVEEAQDFFFTHPFVRLNLKKVAGTSYISNDVLKRYINETESLLIEQLKLYSDASIYLDCTRRHGLELLKKIYPDIQAFGEHHDEWIFYSMKSKVIIVNSYHPSYPQIAIREYYNDMRKALKSFFEEYPNFI